MNSFSKLSIRDLIAMPRDQFVKHCKCIEFMLPYKKVRRFDTSRIGSGTTVYFGVIDDRYETYIFNIYPYDWFGYVIDFGFLIVSEVRTCRGPAGAGFIWDSLRYRMYEYDVRRNG